MEIVLGAAVALLGAVIGTIALEWLTGRRLERHLTEERMRKLRGLRAEMAENTVLDTGGSWRKAPFSTDAWEEGKSVLAELEPEIEEAIRHAYVRVRSHNALIEYDRASMESGRGSLDADIRKSASRVVEAMQGALQALDARMQDGRR
jgi:hypothetical protein